VGRLTIGYDVFVTYFIIAMVLGRALPPTTRDASSVNRLTARTTVVVAAIGLVTSLGVLIGQSRWLEFATLASFATSLLCLMGLLVRAHLSPRARQDQ